MSKTKFTTIKRTAMWRANGQRCFYCEEPVAFCDLQVDHIIPESISEQRFLELTRSLQLGEEFDLNSCRNLVPTNHHCNRRKSDLELSESSLRYYLELWDKKQSRVARELRSLERQASSEKLLTTLAAQIEMGYLAIWEVVQFVQGLSQDYSRTTSEPWVIGFGLNVIELIESGDLSPKAPDSYPALYDWLERQLLHHLRHEIPCISGQLEATQRTGETLTVRVAFWSFDLNHLDEVDISPWEILEIGPYSDICGEDWDSHFVRAIVETYNATIEDPNDPIFGLAYCPKCGSPRLRKWSASRPEDGEQFFFIECEQCGWAE